MVVPKIRDDATVREARKKLRETLALYARLETVFEHTPSKTLHTWLHSTDTVLPEVVCIAQAAVSRSRAAGNLLLELFRAALVEGARAECRMKISLLEEDAEMMFVDVAGKTSLSFMAAAVRKRRLTKRTFFHSTPRLRRGRFLRHGFVDLEFRCRSAR